MQVRSFWWSDKTNAGRRGCCTLLLHSLALCIKAGRNWGRAPPQIYMFRTGVRRQKGGTEIRRHAVCTRLGTHIGAPKALGVGPCLVTGVDCTHPGHRAPRRRPVLRDSREGIR
jgi:hypothetical protein